MDPNACLDRAESALHDNDHEECESALDDYAAWRSRGGFEPDGGDRRAMATRRLLVRATDGVLATDRDCD